MSSHKWLTITEAADYTRVNETYFREKLKKGEGPLYSWFGDQELFNTDQLDAFLFNMQVESVSQEGTTASECDSGLSSSFVSPTAIEKSQKEDSAEYQELTKMQDFMQQACSLWDDGEMFTSNFRTKGSSCQCQGEPRLWIFETKFQVPSDEQGNNLYEPIRTALREYFPQVTGKATVHINRSGFSWYKFQNFIRDIKEISRKSLSERGLVSISSCNDMSQDGDSNDVYNKCICEWEEPPDFTIVYGTRGCSARYKKESRLWFFENYIRIPAESQNNPLYQEIVTIKNECFPNLRTKTKIPFKILGISWPGIEAFITKVKLVR